MLCPDLREVRVYLHRAPVDMRKQRNGLAALVRAVINEDPFRSDALFCFIGKGKDKLKILYWSRYGNRVIMGSIAAMACFCAFDQGCSPYTIPIIF
jgi:transposase